MANKIYLNTDNKVLRNGGRKASASTSLESMFAKEWKTYVKAESEYYEIEDDWSFANPPEETFDFLSNYLFDKLYADLSKVVFDMENCDWDGENFTSDDMLGDNGSQILGYNRLDNGLEYFGVLAGGDWEIPLFFIIYTDGKKLRAYIPTYGNSFNAELGTAIGSEYESDKFEKVFEKYAKAYPTLLKDKYADDERDFVTHCFVSKFTDDANDWYDRIDIDAEKVIEDIKCRIEVI